MKGFLHIITDGKVVYFSSMDIDQLRAICTALPAVTEDIKWGHDLVFSVGGSAGRRV
jgi:hypothetical protein